MIRGVLLAAAFAVEIWALVAFAIAGVRIADGWIGWAVAAVAVVVAASAWGYWAAPKSTNRLAGGRLVVFKLAFFTIAAALLLVAGSPMHAAALLVTAWTVVGLLTVLDVDVPID